MTTRTCVTPCGGFAYAIHKPTFCVENMRVSEQVSEIGRFEDGVPVKNRANFPPGPVHEPRGARIIEIPNPFPFRGTTYIIKKSADHVAENLESIAIPDDAFGESTLKTLEKWARSKKKDAGGQNVSGEAGDEAFETAIEKEAAALFSSLPEPLLLAAAATSRDSDELILLAKMACDFAFDSQGFPAGLLYPAAGLLYPGMPGASSETPIIKNGSLFETVAGNPFLPDDYKVAMVLKPGIQGHSEIVGEYLDESENTHVFEYLRRNSYIPWGHFAANMAHDSIRYRMEDLSLSDIVGMRRLYYQRTYVRMAAEWGIDLPAVKRTLSEDELEALREKMARQFFLRGNKTASPKRNPAFNGTLWGWNFGFDFSPSKYNLHASHQQVHQQFSLIPSAIAIDRSHTARAGHDRAPDFHPYACGDLIADFIREYKKETGEDFFDAYLTAMETNQRLDQREDLPKSLLVWEDDHAWVFVPKAQTSQWELQVMPKTTVAHILDADAATRNSLDRGIFASMKALSGLGAKLITGIEYSGRFDSPNSGQRLIYSFMPKLPWSPGAFSEAQLRWINGHYPEDFAAACRMKIGGDNDVFA